MEITPAIAQILADLTVIFHFSFVIFVLFGALLLLRWRKLIWFHLPCMTWGILVELTGWYCPLTPLENYFRAKAGLGLYSGDFVMEYIMPILYPQGLTRDWQMVFGLIVIMLNGLIYGYVIRKWLKSDAGN